jgi:ATP phosphoribosyltransferase regulatory subunit
MGQWRFHTPDGVQDGLPDDCARKRAIESSLRTVFASRGYLEVETPGLEFYDVYAAGGGLAPQEALYKLFDPQGRILALRYDGTVPVARLAATLLKDEEPPLRLAYIGNMLRYAESGGGKQSEFTQAGVELMGPRTAEADAEVIATAIESARAAGIGSLQVAVGQVEFFKALLEEWGIADEDARRLPGLIDAKETLAIEELADRAGLPAAAREALLAMASFEGTFDVLDRMEALTRSPRALSALQGLRDVLRLLEEDGLLRYVSVDLGMLQSLDYYTGIIFKGFTYGIGFPVITGGRYDRVVSEFGRALPSTGFSLGVNLVMAALRRQGSLPDKAGPDVLFGYDPTVRGKAMAFVAEERAAGRKVACDVQRRDEAGLRAEGARRGIARVLYMDARGEVR